ncbi:hypothetical protein AXG93_4034s1030 [Marchantia polymorpha subsp. ruderalis]|uniref:Uncharacterized protein n=1 Tax=Marchantia polymorpha subsp. ruderalis TaxID=1480154 RepID=A0A176WND0_MARPO|nr:hypothetical protein AXG93_4034s1030 [Marchantia polymorpha subsp. ruderalis]
MAARIEQLEQRLAAMAEVGRTSFMRLVPPSDLSGRTETSTLGVVNTDTPSSVVTRMASSVMRSPLFSATKLIDFGIDLARVFRLEATLCERGSVTTTSAEIDEAIIEELSSTTRLSDESTWQAATARMEFLPARLAIDRVSFVPESYDVLVGGTVLYLMGFWMDYWTETVAYRPGWQSGDGHMSELPVRFISAARPLGSAILASVAGFSGVLTWPDDLLEGNRSSDDTLVYEDVEEVMSFAAAVSSSLDVPLWSSCHALQLEANRLVKKAWSEASLPAEAERVSGGRLVCSPSTNHH